MKAHNPGTAKAHPYLPRLAVAKASLSVITGAASCPLVYFGKCSQHKPLYPQGQVTALGRGYCPILQTVSLRLKRSLYHRPFNKDTAEPDFELGLY